MKKTNINALNMERYIYYLKDINFEESTYLDYLKTQKHFIALHRQYETDRNEYISNLFNIYPQSVTQRKLLIIYKIEVHCN